MNSITTNLWTEVTDDRAEAVNGGSYCYYEKPKYYCYEPKKEDKKEYKKEYKCYDYKYYCYKPKSYC